MPNFPVIDVECLDDIPIDFPSNEEESENN